MVFLDKFKYLPFISMVYVLILMAVWGLNLLSFRSMGFAGFAISLAATLLSFAAVEYLREGFGDHVHLVFALILAIAYFVSMATFSFAFSPSAVIATVFLLVPPLSLFVKTTLGGSAPPLGGSRQPSVPEAEDNRPIGLDL